MQIITQSLADLYSEYEAEANQLRREQRRLIQSFLKELEQHKQEQLRKDLQ
jgi:hypothetical protein